MSHIWQLRREARTALTAAAVSLCAGLSIGSMFLTVFHVVDLMSSGKVWADVMAVASPFVFLFACALVFTRPAIGYRLGGIAVVVALP
jgi:hypothetical protein